MHDQEEEEGRPGRGRRRQQVDANGRRQPQRRQQHGPGAAEGNEERVARRMGQAQRVGRGDVLAGVPPGCRGSQGQNVEEKNARRGAYGDRIRRPGQAGVVVYLVFSHGLDHDESSPIGKAHTRLTGRRTRAGPAFPLDSTAPKAAMSAPTFDTIRCIRGWIRGRHLAEGDGPPAPAGGPPELAVPGVHAEDLVIGGGTSTLRARRYIRASRKSPGAGWVLLHGVTHPGPTTPPSCASRRRSRGPARWCWCRTSRPGGGSTSIPDRPARL